MEIAVATDYSIEILIEIFQGRIIHPFFCTSFAIEDRRILSTALMDVFDISYADILEKN
jgi:hypothetical protein